MSPEVKKTLTHIFGCSAGGAAAMGVLLGGIEAVEYLINQPPSYAVHALLGAFLTASGYEIRELLNQGDKTNKVSWQLFASTTGAGAGILIKHLS